MISVILPTFNRDKTVADAVESVLNQTYANLELIVVDDGSVDNTEQTLSRFLADSRFRYVKQKNSGAADARNTGLDLASGDLIAFIDSDDIWLESKLEAQMAVFEALPEVCAVFSDFYAMTDGVRIEKSHIMTYFSIVRELNKSIEDIFESSLLMDLSYAHPKVGVFWGFIYDTMIFGNLILTSTCLFKRQVFDKIGKFDTKYKTLEDYDLYLRITKEFSVAYVDVPLVYYGYGEKQLSGASNQVKVCYNYLDIFLRNLLKLDDPTFFRNHKDQFYKHLGIWQSNAGYIFFSLHKLKLARKFYFKSFINHLVLPRTLFYFCLCLLPVNVLVTFRQIKHTISGVKN